jgi:1-acyl-sn-glycerol-3-phosphate acyltransferase
MRFKKVKVLKTILWFIGFGLYMIGTIEWYIKLIWLKRKRGTQEEIDKYVYLCGKRWANFVIKTVGAAVKVEGIENIPQGNCLFVSNHQGNLDVPILLSLIDKHLGFVAKKELEKAPILSDWMRQLHCIFMDRDNVREAVKSINEGIEYLKSGYSMVIFPEGTRSKSSSVGEFKKGSMKFALKSNVPIVPIAINGSYKAFEEYNRIRSCSVKVIIGKPIYIEELSKEDQNNLSKITKDIIQNALMH